MSENKSFNRLGEEKSAYLLQHKDNPVHWWAFGPEAIQRAKDENKPIFLSVGYSTCHWCHVMAHESFEDQATADLINKNFIAIKVDREEHPDIDSYYQMACQLYTKTGGWPLSAFCTPDLKPFFVGTYFPKTAPKGGAATFTDILTELNRAFTKEREQVEQNANEATEQIEKGFVPREKVEFEGHFPPPAAILGAVEQFQDKEDGGYGGAPKFPQFAYYEWAIEQMLEGMIQKNQGEHIIKSIEKMLMGGIFDHARGGIHRYSTDKSWTVPHFEKMLYDQAGLLKLLSKASLIYPSPLVFDGIMNTLEYLEKEMMSEEGYFFSAQDADSEGQEGLYFTYSEAEFDDVLKNASDDNDDLVAKADEIKSWFNITKEGNFTNALNVISLNFEKRNELFTQDNWQIVRRVRKAILEDRKQRIPPATDSKGLASWNLLMLSSLIDVMQYVQITPIRQKASAIFNTLVEGVYKTFLVSKDEKATTLRHSTTKPSAFPLLEDYVFFSDSQIRLYEITGNPIFKDNALDTINFILQEFVEGENILTRSKLTSDHELYPNQTFSSFDTSFRSAAATLVSVVRRARLLFMDPELGSSLNDAIEKMTHEALRNPIGSGEALRALTYPDTAYRLVKIPKSWLTNDKFLGFISYFLPRFTLDYVEDTEQWQICNLEQCELQGEGVDNFIETLRPSKPAEEASKE